MPSLSLTDCSPWSRHGNGCQKGWHSCYSLGSTWSFSYYQTLLNDANPQSIIWSIIPNGQCSLLISKLQSFKKKIPSSKLLALSYTSKVNSSSVRTQHYVKQFLFKLYFYTQLCVHVKENASWLHKMC